MIELNVIRDTERGQLNKKRKILSPVFPDKEIFAASFRKRNLISQICQLLLVLRKYKQIFSCVLTTYSPPLETKTVVYIVLSKF